MAQAPLKEAAPEQKIKVSKARVLTVKNIYDKHYDILKTSGIWREVLGETEANGAWLIKGLEKNGKTWLALLAAKMLSENYRVLYISAEEGVGKAFRDTLKRIGVDTSERNIHFLEYEDKESLEMRLKKRKSAEVVIVDNMTIYNEEFKGNALRMFLSEFRNKLFIFLAHEERGEPYTASAKMVQKLAKVIYKVKGLAVTVSGRIPGGTLIIDETKAQLFHGNSIKNESKKNEQEPAILTAPEAEGVLQGGVKKKADTHTRRRKD